MVCGIQVTVVQEKSVLSRTSRRAGIGDLEWHRQGGLIRWFQQSHCQLAKHRDYARPLNERNRLVTTGLHSRTWARLSLKSRPVHLQCGKRAQHSLTDREPAG
jgi:hypothetical protein